LSVLATRLAAGGGLSALAALARLPVVPVPTKLAEEAGPVALLLEGFQRSIEALVVVDDDFHNSALFGGIGVDPE
jgi:hypothetical protein